MGRSGNFGLDQNAPFPAYTLQYGSWLCRSQDPTTLMTPWSALRCLHPPILPCTEWACYSQWFGWSLAWFNE